MYLVISDTDFDCEGRDIGYYVGHSRRRLFNHPHTQSKLHIQINKCFYSGTNKEWLVNSELLLGLER